MKTSSDIHSPEDILPALLKIAKSIITAAVRDEQLRSDISNFLATVEALIQPEPLTLGKPDDAPATDELAGTDHAAERTLATPKTDAEPIPVVNDVAVQLQEAIESGLARSSRARMFRPKSANKEPAQIVQECRIKAEACRWKVERQNLMGNFYDDVKPRDEELIRRAKTLSNCYLWMCTPKAPTPNPVGLYLELASCFENAGDAIELVSQALHESDESALEASMLLLAEAQSSLRVGVGDIGLREPDSTQDELFHYLRGKTIEKQVFVPRYMLRTDGAAPANAPDLKARIGALSQKFRENTNRKKEEQNALGTIRFHVRILDDETNRTKNWQRIVETLTSAVPGLINATDPRLRSLLLGHLDSLPEDVEVSESAQSVLDALDQFLAEQPGEEESLQTQQHNATVMKVRDRLRGTKIVVIGGEARAYAREALRNAFDLAEVIWETTRAHESHTRFRPAIETSGVSIVVLAIRWSSHAFGNVKSYCERAGVRLVRLPGGYGPNQVAAQILAQHPTL